MEARKGYLVVLDKQKKINFDISICDGRVCDDSKEFYDYYQKLTIEDRKIIDKCFSNIEESKINDPKAKELLFNFCKNKITNYRKVIPVIYNETVDTEGNKYGCVLVRHYAFPIPKEIRGSFELIGGKKINNVYRRSKSIKYDEPKPTNPIFYPHGRSIGDLTIKFIDKNHKKYYTSSFGTKKTHELYSSSNGVYAAGYSPAYYVVRTNLNRYKISMSLEFVHDNMNRMEVVLLENGFANQKEIDHYMYDTPYTLDYYRLNAFKDDDLANQENMDKKNSDVLDLINKIEATLLRIKEINENLYNQLNDEYNRLIGSNDYKTINKEKQLNQFYNSIKDKQFLSDSPEASIIILDRYIDRIINDLKNGLNPNIYLPYLTRLHDEIISYQKRYPLADIKIINERMNMLYFLFLYANKNQFNIPEDTSYTSIPFYKEITINTYIKDNIVGILNVIQKLLDMRIIEENDMIMYHKVDCFYKPETTNLPHLLDFISDINIKDINDTKELIKR